MELPYEIQAKWRRNLFNICVVLALIGTVCEIAIYLVDSSKRTLFLPSNIYRLRFIYIPSSLNLVMILITHFCLKAHTLSNKAKNVWSCLLIFFLCFNTQFIHYVYGPLLALPCLAIFVSVLFASKKLTLSISIASCVSILVSCAVASQELRKDDPQLLSDMGLALVIMLVSYIGASLLIKYVRQQIEFILKSTNRENELLRKLQLDTLLGIYNRNKMEEVIDEMIHSDDNGANHCLLMLDLDYFKRVNDRFGHLCGDEVLVRLADIIRQRGKRNIVPCRYGGEEIVVFLKDASFEEAYEFADNLLKEFREQRYSFDPSMEVTFSCGISVYRSGMLREDWLKQVDDNLYKAKWLGRNQIYPSKTGR